MKIDLDGTDEFLAAAEEIETDMATDAAFEVYTNISYGFWQEFGTSEQSGTPHLRPGFYAGIQSFEEYAQSNSTRRAMLLTAIKITRKVKELAPVEFGTLRESYDFREI